MSRPFAFLPLCFGRNSQTGCGLWFVDFAILRIFDEEPYKEYRFGFHRFMQTLPNREAIRELPIHDWRNPRWIATFAASNRPLKPNGFVPRT